jgi:hypothetical protein
MFSPDITKSDDPEGEAMSSSLDFDLEILTNSTSEMNQIAERLKRPSTKLADFVAKESSRPFEEIMEGLKELLAFKVAENPRYSEARTDKAGRFSLSFMDRSRGILNSHLFEVSQEFPAAVFLLEYSNTSDYAGKKVIRAGEVVHQVHDPSDWCPLDVFAPFKTEYYNGQPFGSLWPEWLGSLEIAVGQLSPGSLAARNSAKVIEFH